jgi:signal transduction histidine kinase
MTGARHAGELSQVWTNLIDNAVDAMNGAGTLRVSTRADRDVVVVDDPNRGPPPDPSPCQQRISR